MIILSIGPPVDSNYGSISWTAKGDVVYRQPGKVEVYCEFENQLDFDRYIDDHGIKIRLWPVTEVVGDNAK